MKLTGAEIVNFKSHVWTVVPFRDGLNVIVGPSGAGKSSVLDAIAACLTGRNRLTDARGSGLKQLARNGTGEVMLKVQAVSPSGNTLEFQRDYSPSSNLLKINGVPTENGQVKEALGLDQAQLLALFDSKPLAERDAAELRAVFGNLLSPSKFAERFQKIGVPVPPSMESLEKLIKTTKEKDLRDARRDHKAVLADLETTRAKVEQAGATLDRQKIQEGLKRKRDAKQQAQTYGAAESQLGQLKQKLQQVTHGESDLKQMQASLAIVQAEIVGQQETMAKLQQALAQLSSVARQEASSPYDACQLAVCPMKKKKAAAKPDGLTAEQKKKKAKEVSDAVAALRADTDDNRNKAANLQAAIGLYIQIASVKLPEKVEVGPEIDAEIAALEEQLREADRVSFVQEQVADLTERAEQKRQEAERLEAKVMAMSQIRDEIAATMGSLAGEVSRFCQPFIGPVRFDTDSMMFAAQHESKALSSGEQVILDAAVRCALSRHIGAGCVIVDHFNHLSEDEAKKLRGALMSTGQQVVAIWATNKKPPHIDGVNILYLSKENGQTKIEAI